MNFVKESRTIEGVSIASLIIGATTLAHIIIQDAETVLVAASAVVLTIPLILGMIRRISSRRSIAVEILTFAAVAVSAAAGSLLFATLMLLTVCFCRVAMDYAVSRAYAGIRNTLEMTPRTVTVVRDGKKVPVRTADVKKGEIVHVRSGDHVALDGRIVKGSGCIDTSLLDGRTESSFRKVGEIVRGGTVNLFGFFDMEVVCPLSDGTVSNLVSIDRSMEEGHFEAAHISDRIMDLAFAGSFTVMAAAVLLSAPADGLSLFALISVPVTLASIAFLYASGRLEGTDVENRYACACCKNHAVCDASETE